MLMVWFKFCEDRVAQSVEHLTFNQVAVGSSPTAVTSKIFPLFSTILRGNVDSSLSGLNGVRGE